MYTHIYTSPTHPVLLQGPFREASEHRQKQKAVSWLISPLFFSGISRVNTLSWRANVLTTFKQFAPQKVVTPAKPRTSAGCSPRDYNEMKLRFFDDGVNRSDRQYYGFHRRLDNVPRTLRVCRRSSGSARFHGVLARFVCWGSRKIGGQKENIHSWQPESRA